jgi:hypothetical protein
MARLRLTTAVVVDAYIIDVVDTKSVPSAANGAVSSKRSRSSSS